MNRLDIQILYNRKESDMTRTLSIALIALVASVGAAFAMTPDAFMTDARSNIDHELPSQYALADRASVIMGARIHDCNTDLLMGAMIAAVGEASDVPVLTAIGMYLTIRGMTMCAV